MTTRRTGLARAGLTAIVAGFLLAIFGFVAPASASVADPEPESYDGNLACADLGYALEFKIDYQPVAGTFDEGDAGIQVVGDLPDDLFVTISNVESPGGRLEFDWSSNYAWSVVLVKQANGGLKYVYEPPVTSDQNVQTVEGQNEGGISHVTFCGPVTPPEEEEECPEGTTWVDDGDGVVEEGECQTPEEPEAELAASLECGDPTGMTVTVTNTGDANGTVDITSDGGVVADDLVVPAGGAVDQNVAIDEGDPYDIAVVGVETFTGTRDCEEDEEEVEGVVIPKTPEAPVKPAVQVKGVQVQAQELPRTGDDELTLALIGLGLVLVGGGALLLSRDHATA